MTFSFYEISVPIYQQYLRSLSRLIDKAEQHCAEKGLEPSTLLGARLYQDMQPFTFQITQAIGHSAGALANVRGSKRERVTGLDSFAACKEAVEQALADIDAVQPSELENVADNTVEYAFPGGSLTFTARGYLLSYAMPQFFFHVTVAYGLLRQHGVPIGKRDFLGRIKLKPK